LENWHSDSLKKVQLTLSQGKKKKGENVADDEDDDAVRNSVSQDQVTATLCIEELFLSPQYIQYSFPPISEGQPFRKFTTFHCSRKKSKECLIC
jgi:hypothetical protein